MSAMNDWLLQCPLPSHLACFLLTVFGTSQLSAMPALHSVSAFLSGHFSRGTTEPKVSKSPLRFRREKARMEEEQDERGQISILLLRPQTVTSLTVSFFLIVKGIQHQIHSYLQLCASCTHLLKVAK